MVEFEKGSQNLPPIGNEPQRRVARAQRLSATGHASKRLSATTIATKQDDPDTPEHCLHLAARSVKDDKTELVVP